MVSSIDWESKDINTVYDVFYEKGTRLGGAYNSLRSRARAVGDEDAVKFWTEQIVALRRERSDVHPDDRAAMVERIERWGSMVSQLDLAERAGAYLSAA